MLRIITSRYMEAAVIVLWIVALTTRQHWLLVFSVILAAIVVAGLVAVFVVSQYRARKVWKNFPDTPEYGEYASKQESGQEETDKNTIELK